MLTHIFETITLLFILTLVGVEFAVSAFVNPAAARLESDAQLIMLSRFAIVLGKVMPIWYPAATVLMLVETWLRWHAPERSFLLLGDVIWILTSVISILYLVPLNDKVAKSVPDWAEAHKALGWSASNSYYRFDRRSVIAHLFNAPINQMPRYA